MCSTIFSVSKEAIDLIWQQRRFVFHADLFPTRFIFNVTTLVRGYRSISIVQYLILIIRVCSVLTPALLIF